MLKQRIWKFSRLAAAAFAAIGLMALGACRPNLGRDHSDRILHHLDHRVHSLDLSPEQEQKYQTLRAKIGDELHKNYQARVAALMQAKTEFNKEEPDVRALAQFVRQQLQSRQNFILQTPDYFVEFYSILNAEQRRTVRDWVRDHLEDFEPEQ
ncbi:MAG: Spy/CpxP family protein refolding chaperone [Leptospirales bacterium]|nr:Spy/CpxP family protein refolding chaperone [Leptospirales bacterium]